ncbi:MAG TPA: sigma-70 family RNA polymerase sigma factor [Candidatus Dormibacteraeota bacterium]|nr:sigma-70 family RNA polymerase sigma factor [Candidatus Dormibacteraeota bacterium]
MDGVADVGGGGGGSRERQIVEWAYEAYRAELVGRSMALVHDEATAEDLAQDAFLRLQVEVEAGRRPDNVRAWLHRVVGNLVVSRGRRSQVAARRNPRLVAWESGPSTEDVAIRRDTDARLVAALDSLTRRDREVLLMAASGLSGPEIALRTGRSAVAIRTLLCRARVRLRDQVERLERSA